ncbi:MAG: hypothetical protein V3W34_20165 [Phycisphaerae bacterium]
MNLWLLISLLFLLVIALVLGLMLWTGIRVGLTVLAQRRAHAEYRKSSRRADGQPYPPYIEGVCSQCSRGNLRIYHPPSGERLCPECYERFWRSVTGWRSPASEPTDPKK